MTFPQRGVVQSDSVMDKGGLESISLALGKEQSVTEQAPLFADDGVQSVPNSLFTLRTS